ncbi:3'-5' exonuclease domain [Dillenia turbinata]|uniref:3'-5' exonuclease domain n=1 Tax=Dillenia turbinata TaxID=194707 RepID=A0AAN8UA52_9MAGN
MYTKCTLQQQWINPLENVTLERYFGGSSLAHGMGLEEIPTDIHNKKGKPCEARPICLHAFSDLTYISPVVFLYLLKECYVCGTSKATTKFRALQRQVHRVLYNAPQPSAATFVLQCLYVLPLFESYCEGFSHLLISSFRRFVQSTKTDITEGKDLAAQLFLDVVEGLVPHGEKIAAKLLEVFDIGLVNIENVMCNSEVDNSSLGAAKTFLEQYISKLIESQSYEMAVSVLEQFSIRQSGETFLLKMMQNKEFRAAEKWATFMGPSVLHVLVQEYLERNMLKSAYLIIKKHHFRQDYPDVCHKYKESSLKKLAEKGCWDVAELKANRNCQLIEYLVYLAMEAGYSEKVDELCKRYSLEGFVKTKELVVEDIIWVDEVNSLCDATSYIEGCKVIGIDCEWKPNYIKGSQPNKVSIMQIASEKKVFILDLIKLFEDAPEDLDCCLTSILHSSRILKLGYNFQCDIKQLAHSYAKLVCFKHYEMLLDIQNVFKEPRGGLSGLAKKILGTGLNKTRRNSNWEQRPLGKDQLEYAALDAVVLIHIFSHVRSEAQPSNISQGNTKIEWKSHIF